MIIFDFAEKDDYLIVVFLFYGYHKGTFGMKIKRKSVETQDLVEGTETWVFTDTECKIDRNISFQWNQLIQDFLIEDY